MTAPAAPTTRTRKARLPPPRTQPRLLAFGWYGGKFSHLNWLLPLLPACHHYCEPFGGSAAVLLNRPPSPVETYNDIDGDLVTFFRVLRDGPAELERLIALTPFARTEFSDALVIDPSLPDAERARRFYVRARQVWTGLAQTATLGRWSNCKDSSRGGMANAVSRWLGGVEDLPGLAARLLRVQIECRPAAEVVALYDGPGTLFYCDPPYVHDTRGDTASYRYEMTDDEHRAFAAVLQAVVGQVVVSGYACPLTDELFPAPKWRAVHSPARTNHATKGQRVETVWLNF